MRMIHKNISRSQKIASLSPQSQLLFMMLIPHFSSYGKMYGGAGYIKDVVCPLITSLPSKIIEKCLDEINVKTNVKKYKVDGIQYLQALSWDEHQNLRKDRLGADQFPSYSNQTAGVTPELVRPEVKEKEKVKKKVKEKEKSARVAEKCLAEMTSKYPQYDIPKNLDVFYDYCKAHGKKYKNYDAAFRNRMSNNFPKAMKGGGGLGKKPSPAEFALMERIKSDEMAKINETKQIQEVCDDKS